ncbi:MAG TPA: FAD:protein FMN transferase, partial [Draconibacterium sp.]|nr:FAD:protein FMN transferase [Draconibacterium sp.]
MKSFAAILLILLPFFLTAQEEYTRTLKLMGSRFDITVLAENESAGNTSIDLAIEEISRIERMISSWDDLSETSEIIRNAGIQPVKTDQELFDLIARAIKISELTDGAFDISYASMDNIWKFNGSMNELPSAKAIAESVEKVGYKNI